MGLFRKLGRGLIKLIDGAITFAVAIAAVVVVVAATAVVFAFVAGIVMGLGAAGLPAIGITAGVFALGVMFTKSGIKNHAGSSVKCKPIFTFPTLETSANGNPPAGHPLQQRNTATSAWKKTQQQEALDRENLRRKNLNLAPVYQSWAG